MNPTWKVRPATADDAGDIARIQVGSLRALGISIDEGEIASRWAGTLAAAPPPGFVTVVAQHGDQVVGFSAAGPAEALDDVSVPEGIEVLAMDVDPNFRRSGHASRMLNAVVDLLAPESVRVWIDPEDDARVCFWQSAGFAPAGLRRQMEGPEGTTLSEHLWWAARAAD